MHHFAYRLMAGASRAAMAPNNDDGFEDSELNGGEGDDDFDEDLDEDDEGEGDEDDSETVDQDDADPRERSRGETRQAKLARERNELRDRNEQLQRDLDAARRNPAPAAVQGESPDQFRARLDAMDPLDRMAYLQNLQANATTQQIQALQFQIADSGDKGDFNTFCATNTQAAKLKSEVETRLVEYRKQGVNIPRMDVLKHILGDRALANSGRSRNRTERQAEQRREAQRAKPGSGRSDAGRTSDRETNDKAARDRRVENMKI